MNEPNPNNEQKSILSASAYGKIYAEEYDPIQLKTKIYKLPLQDFQRKMLLYLLDNRDFFSKSFLSSPILKQGIKPLSVSPSDQLILDSLVASSWLLILKEPAIKDDLLKDTYYGWTPVYFFSPLIALYGEGQDEFYSLLKIAVDKANDYNKQFQQSLGKDKSFSLRTLMELE